MVTRKALDTATAIARDTASAAARDATVAIARDAANATARDTDGRARVPLVAIVGRPNVGKSTLFNRLVGKRAALVDDQPGVTRDRIFGEARISGRLWRVVDTGGIDTTPGQFVARVREQTELAIAEADLIVLLLDASEGLTPADRDVAQMLRRSGKPTLVVGNKIDVPEHESRMGELYELGFDAILPLSAEHGRYFGDLIDEIIKRVNPPAAEDYEAHEAPLPVQPEEPLDEEAAALEEQYVGKPIDATRIEWSGGPIRVAVVGRPNVGKSSLVNRMLGEERHLASALPGTTRDSIDSTLEHGEQTFIFTDTAGIRRKRSIDERLERFAVMMSMRSLDGADVALVLLDAAEPPSDQDARIAAMAIQRGKGLILVANKWDLCRGEDASTAFSEAVERQLGFAGFAPFLRVSAKTGRGVEAILEAVVRVQRERHRRVGTGELNRFFRDVVEDSPPPMHRGHRPRLYFVSQPLVRPPTFVFTASHSTEIRDSYQRYLSNALRKRYGFSGTPLWVKFRQRKSKDGSR